MAFAVAKALGYFTDGYILIESGMDVFNHFPFQLWAESFLSTNRMIIQIIWKKSFMNR